MGRPKAELPVAGTTLLPWLLERLGGYYFAEVLVCGAPAPARARSVADLRPDAGPLGGIEAGLLAIRSDAAFVLACDIPRASLHLADLLFARSRGHDAAVPRIGGRAQPTCAVYWRRAAPKITTYLDAGGRRATEVLASLDVAYVDDDELLRERVAARELDDLDTPAEYEAFIASLAT
jgi:molybdopterin-guanine dinucleotide biosynthesis protein A